MQQTKALEKEQRENRSAARRGQKGARHPLVDDMHELMWRMEQNRRLFDLTCDEDLVDALIYEHNALMARYAYLLKQARLEGVTLNGIKQPQWIQARRMDTAGAAV